MRYFMLVCVAAVGLVGPASAADPPKVPKELALVPKDGLAFLSLNAATVWEQPALKGLRDGLVKSSVTEGMLANTGLTFDQLERFTVVGLTSGENRDRPGEPIVVMILTARKPIDKAAAIRAMKLYTPAEIQAMRDKKSTWDKLPQPTGKAEAAHYIGKDIGQGERFVAFVDDRTVVLHTPGGLVRDVLQHSSPVDLLKTTVDTGPLAAGLALAVEHPVALAVNTTGLKAILGRGVPEEVAPLLRADNLTAFAKLGTEAADITVTTAFAGMQWADDGEASAKKLKEMGTFLLKEQAKRMLARGDGVDSVPAEFIGTLATLLEKGTVTRAGNGVTLTARYDLGAKTQAILAAMPAATTEASTSIRSINNLKQIGLACHNFESVYQHFPSNIHSADGKALLSWRVHLLPYLEYGELYKQFKLDEPWDSDNNKKLIEKMPTVYALPGVKAKDAGQTFYQSFISKKNPVSRSFLVEGEKKGPVLISITDGTSNTFLCVEAAEPVIWSKPDDLPFELNGKLPKFGGHYVKDRFQALFCDGSTRLMNAALPEATLKAYITTSGGEVIKED